MHGESDVDMKREDYPKLLDSDYWLIRCPNCHKRFLVRHASVEFHEVVFFCSDNCREEFYEKHHARELREIELGKEERS